MVHILPPITAAGQAAPTQPPVRRSTQFARVEKPTQEAADAFAAAAVAVLATAAVNSAEVDVPTIDVSTTSVAGSAEAGYSTSLGWFNGLWLERPLVMLGSAATALVLVGGLTFAVWPDREDASGGVPPIGALADVGSAPIVSALSQVPEQPSAVAVADTASESLTDLPAPVPMPERPVAAAGSVSPATPIQQTDTAPAAIMVANERPIVVAATQVAVAAAPANEPQAAADKRGSHVFTLDPLGFDPSRLSLPPGGPSAAPSEASLAAASVKHTADATSANSDQAPGAANRNQRQPPGAEENPTITVRRGPPSSEPTQKQAMAARLALPVQSMIVRGVPLVRVLDQISDMAGTSITIDPAALELTGVSPRREVSIDMQGTTIDGVLKELLGRQRLGVTEQRGELVVVRPAGNLQLPPTYDVSDILSPGEKDAGRIAGLIQRFVAPDSWEAVGGKGALSEQGTTLQIQQTEQNHIALIVFCERLRAARGLPPKSRYPAERLFVESPYLHLAEKLGRPTTFTFVPWTRLADVARDWSERSSVTMLVDWQVLSELELAPSSPLACSAVARTWEDALDEILAPLELGWRAIDGETIQITSAAAAEKQRAVEFFKLPGAIRDQFANHTALIETFQRELTEKVGAAAATVEMAVDGDRLIVLGNAAAHRYLTKRLAGE
jgi:hypothetical protein